MRFILILILIPILLLGQKFLLQKQHIGNPVKTNITKTPTISPSLSLTTTPSPTETTSKSTTTPTSLFVPTNTPTNQPANNSNTSNFVYPNSKQDSSSGSSITLESNDDAATITNWYKDKIKSLGWNTTSIAENDVNDNVNNQLVAANGSQQVKISITKNASDSVVHISVSM